MTAIYISFYENKGENVATFYLEITKFHIINFFYRKHFIFEGN